MESNVGKALLIGYSQWMTILGGFMSIFMGILMLAFGAGACFIVFGIWLIGAGIGWWGSSRGKTLLSAEQQQDSRMLVQTVDYCLMKELENQGVSADELRITQAAQTQGIGKLT